ncbi:hypothetical protein ACH47Z_40995 [Streptomyces sp. NPDC020192]|uniref:hypothetical protein n=1 Tax=Streptomyces sp. NPDC020192 TaxID=3365066 RepID=UPI0037B624BB
MKRTPSSRPPLNDCGVGQQRRAFHLVDCLRQGIGDHARFGKIRRQRHRGQEQCIAPGTHHGA